jgi:uncharacterized protein YndB with AHSA1/START domain
MLVRSHSLVVTRSFRTTPQRLYAAWTDPSLMRRWMGVEVEADVRLGGAYRRVVETGDGTRFVHVGRYEALEPNRMIVQSFGLEGVEGNPFEDEEIEVELRPLGTELTELVLTDRWNGPAMTADETALAEDAWLRWLMGIERVVETPSGG